MPSTDYRRAVQTRSTPEVPASDVAQRKDIDELVASVREQGPEMALAMEFGDDERVYVTWGGDQWYGCRRVDGEADLVVWNGDHVRRSVRRSLATGGCYPVPRRMTPLPER